MVVARNDNTVAFHAEAGCIVKFGVATPVSCGAATNFEKHQLEEHLGFSALLLFPHGICCLGLLPLPLAID